jgi:hypothetical protein
MTVREDEFGKTIKGYLDQGPPLRAGVVYRLQHARAAALARAAGQAESAPVPELARAHGLAGIGGGAPAGRPARPFFAQARFWLGLAILAAAIFGYEQWIEWQNLNELEDLDTQILSSDLPIDAYLDRGFQQWLKNASFEQ